MNISTWSCVAVVFGVVLVGVMLEVGGEWLFDRLVEWYKKFIHRSKHAWLLKAVIWVMIVSLLICAAISYWRHLQAY